MARKTHSAWADVERDYRSTRTPVLQIAKRYGINESGIRQKARKEGWTRPGARDLRSNKSRIAPADAISRSGGPVLPVERIVEASTGSEDPVATAERGRGLAERLLDELDAETFQLGEMERALTVATAADDDDRARAAAMRAVTLPVRSQILKNIASALKTLAEISPASGGKKEQQAAAAKVAATGKFATPAPPPRLVVSNEDDG